MLKIYATDERLIVYDDNKKIWDSFPGVVVENNEPIDFITSEEEYHNDNRKIVRTFRGCVIDIGHYSEAEWLLKKAIKSCRKFRPICRIAVSPVNSEIELRCMQDWYRKWYDQKLPLLVYEPTAFLLGINLSDGIVLTQRYSMIEVSIVQNKKIIEYKWGYFDINHNMGKPEIAWYIDSIIDKLLNDCNHFDYSLPIYFTSYNELTDLSDKKFSKYHINKKIYDEFCMTIICGLGKTEIPIISADMFK